MNTRGVRPSSPTGIGSERCPPCKAALSQAVLPLLREMVAESRVPAGAQRTLIVVSRPAAGPAQTMLGRTRLCTWLAKSSTAGAFGGTAPGVDDCGSNPSLAFASVLLATMAPSRYGCGVFHSALS